MNRSLVIIDEYFLQNSSIKESFGFHIVLIYSTVASSGTIKCPILMFVSNGKQVSKNWIENTRHFARQTNAQTVYLKCGHYVHHYESKSISQEIERFISSLK